MPLILCLLATGFHLFTNGNSPMVVASAQPDSWSLTLHVTESTGSGNTVVLGGSSNASDGTDDLDLPEPPPPPQLPYIRAWFATSFSVPFNRLLHEYQHLPAQRLQWNLSIIWVPEPGNNSSTTIEISWDSSQAKESGFGSFQLCENETVVANMLSQNSFSYPSIDTLHRFNIIAQNTPMNNDSGKYDLPVLPIILGIIMLIVAVVLLVVYKRKK